MPNDVTPLNTEDEGLNLWELVDVVKSGWHWLVGGAVTGLLLSVGYVLVVPAQYEATALVQVATVGLGGGTKGTEVEPVAQALERLKTPTFYSAELIKLCQIAPVAAQEALAKAVKPSIIKGNSILQLNYRSDIRQVAVTCLEGVTEALAKSQGVIAAPVIATLEEQRKLTRQQLEEAERFQAQFEKRAMTLDPSDAKFSQAMLMLNAALSKRDEVSKLRRQFADQSLQLSPPLTQPTHLFEPIYASDQPVFPKKTLTALSGLVAGLVLGGVVIFWRRAWVARRAKCAETAVL